MTMPSFPAVRRNAILALALGVGGGLFGSQSAKAQNAAGSPVYGFDPATWSLAHGGDAARANSSGLGSVYLNTPNRAVHLDAPNSANKTPATKPIAVGTDQNRILANKIHDAVVYGIVSATNSQNKSGILSVIESQNQDNKQLEVMLLNNKKLMGLLAGEGEGEFLLSTYVMRSAITDAATYIRNGNTAAKLPTLSESDWKESSSGAQSHINALNPGETEFQFLSNMHKGGSFFVGRTNIASAVIIKAITQAAPALVALR